MLRLKEVSRASGWYLLDFLRNLIEITKIEMKTQKQITPRIIAKIRKENEFTLSNST